MTAKQRLQLSPQIKEVASMVQSGIFEYCADAALLTLTESLGQTTYDPAIAAAHQQQLAGARRILVILKDLATIPSEPKANRIGQLNPQ